MTRTVILTAAFAAWAAGAAAQTTAGTSVSFLPRAAFHMGAERLGAIDLAVDKTDIYILHDDGHTTLCAYSELSVSQTNCTDPAPSPLLS